MAKPSIFSKNYEYKMKKRKKRLAIIIVLAIIAAGVILFNTHIKNMDFSNLRAKMQAWVDSDKPVTENKEEEQKETETEVPKEEEQKEPEKLYMDINIEDGVVAKVQYEEIEGKKQFVNVEPLDGVSFNISPSKDKVLFLDKNQNLKVADINGAVRDITKKEYISQSKMTFPKDQTLASTPTYVWCSQPKFIDDNKIVYVSELPYFQNHGQKLYVWVYDLNAGSDTTIWNFVGSQIEVGDIVPDKGITIKVNGAVYYLSSDGTVTQ